MESNTCTYGWKKRRLYIVLELCNIVVYSVSPSGSRCKFHHQASAVQHVGPPSEALVTKQIRQDIYRCEKMHSSNTV